MNFTTLPDRIHDRLFAATITNYHFVHHQHHQQKLPESDGVGENTISNIRCAKTSKIQLKIISTLGCFCSINRFSEKDIYNRHIFPLFFCFVRHVHQYTLAGISAIFRPFGKVLDICRVHEADRSICIVNMEANNINELLHQSDAIGKQWNFIIVWYGYNEPATEEAELLADVRDGCMNADFDDKNALTKPKTEFRLSCSPCDVRNICYLFD